MDRSNITGFEFTVVGYTAEIVTVNHIPRIFAIWKHTRFIWRIET